VDLATFCPELLATLYLVSYNGCKRSGQLNIN